MSERRVGLRLLVVLLVVAAVAVPGVAYDITTPDRSHAMSDTQFSVLQGHEPAAADGDPAAAPDGRDRRHRRPTERARLEAGLRTIRADEVHSSGITGEGVQVGVVGSGFDPTHRAIAGNVADHRRLGRGRPAAASRVHDTAVAEVVTRTAPDADLYLAGVGESPTPDEYAASVDWLLANDVDVIVDSGSYFTAGGRTGSIGDAAERAADRGVVFVTSAGNYADRHWSGTVGEAGVGTAGAGESAEVGVDAVGADDGTAGIDEDGRTDGIDGAVEDTGSDATDGVEGPRRGAVDDGSHGAGANGWVAFADGVEANALAGGEPTSGRVSLRLSWQGDADYDLYLYRVVGERKRVVAKSVRRQVGNATPTNTESIDVRVPNGRYYVAVYGHDGATGDRLDLFSAHQRLHYATASGSMVAPATSDEVIAVGAYDAKSGKIRQYSSRGIRSRSGGAGVDVSAPDGVETDVAGTFRGTSAAAPYVAGTAALIESSGGDLSPAQVERILETTAREGTGGGRLDSMAAVRAAAERPPTVGDAAGVGAADGGPGANDSAPTPADGAPTVDRAGSRPAYF